MADARVPDAVPPLASAAQAEGFDGVPRDALARRLDVPRLSLHAVVGSTLDVAHALAAAGAPPGTLVLAEEQTAGRGRAGRRWASAPGAGLWLTIVERPSDIAAIDVLSLRAGLRAATVLDRWAEAPVRLKWPNDLYVGDRKLGGILIEARWRDERPDWIALGVGINVEQPAIETGIGLRAPVDRVELLGELLPALRGAAAAHGGLTERELAAYAARDLARGRRCTSPSAGIVAGLAPDGTLLVQDGGRERRHRAGSLVFTEGA